MVNSNYKDFIADKIVSSVVLKDDAHVCISFEDTDKILDIQAYGDCCSVSTFSVPSDLDLNILVGKKLLSICEEPEEEGKSVDDNYEQYCKIIVEYCDKEKDDNEDDNQQIIFNMTNVSNGYYSGWIEISIV